jgi:FkbM family methyltransferase
MRACSIVDRASSLAMYARELADWKSLMDYRRLRDGHFPNGTLVPLRTRCLNKRSVICRAGTTDVAVFREVFFKRCQLPPRRLTPIRAILDLGSNVGFTIAQCAVRYPAARIIGIELDDHNIEMCRRNIAAYGRRCKVIHGAVWDRKMTVYYDGTEEWGYHVVTESAKAPVRTYTMDTLLDMFETAVVDFVKMDIEGAEQKLLRSAKTWVPRVRCMQIEVHAPYDVPSCGAELDRLGLCWERSRLHRSTLIAWNPAC